MSGFNLPPGVSQLPSEQETWQEAFEASDAFKELPAPLQATWDCFGEHEAEIANVLFVWAWEQGYAEALSNEAQAKALDNA